MQVSIEAMAGAAAVLGVMGSAIGWLMSIKSQLEGKLDKEALLGEKDRYHDEQREMHDKMLNEISGLESRIHDDIKELRATVNQLSAKNKIS